MFSLFKSHPQQLESEIRKIEQRQALDRERLERSICASLSRGNVSLQNGEYITSQDMDDLQDELVAYFLPEKSNQ